MITLKDLTAPQKVTWCSGCGNFGILSSLKKALVSLEIPHHEILLVSGIGCSGKLPHYINVNSIHTLHGRAIPVATGAHLVNQDLKVIVHAGDGDMLGEGLGHMLHAARRNVNIAVFVHNNGVMGLTKGQYSPLSPRGYISVTSPPPPGVPMEPVSYLAMAIASGATFVARAFSGKTKHLVEIMSKAIQHKGFAIVDILQPCVTWNRQLTWDYYNDKVYLIEDEYEPSDKIAAIEKVMESNERIPLGVFFQAEKPDLASGLSIPIDGKLKDHQTSLSRLQDIIDRFVLE